MISSKEMTTFTDVFFKLVLHSYKNFLCSAYYVTSLYNANLPCTP
jgi:hypothetical protein